MPLRVKLIYLFTIILALTLIRMVYLTTNEPTENHLVGIRGIVEEIIIENPSENKGTIFVKGSLYKDTHYDQGYAVIDNATEIFHVTDKETLFSIKDLAEGEYIDVYFDGPVMESYPIRGKAKKIIINTIKNVEPETPANGK